MSLDWQLPPSAWQYAVAEVNGERYVVVNITTPYGEAQYLIDVESAFEIAKKIRSSAQQAQSKLEIVQAKLAPANGHITNPPEWDPAFNDDH